MVRAWVLLQMSVRKRYEAMRDALNATGKPILFSMCEWGVSSPWEYGHEVCLLLQSQMSKVTCYELNAIEKPILSHMRKSDVQEYDYDVYHALTEAGYSAAREMASLDTNL